jgi:hypothetical protein
MNATNNVPSASLAAVKAFRTATCSCSVVGLIRGPAGSHAVRQPARANASNSSTAHASGNDNLPNESH